MITVFYDGGCGLCHKEIAYYQRIAPKDRFVWVDLHATPELFTRRGYAIEAGFALMHVEDDKGHMRIGVEAFLTMWRGVGGFWRCLSFVVALPIVKQIAKLAYHVFAKYR